MDESDTFTEVKLTMREKVLQLEASIPVIYKTLADMDMHTATIKGQTEEVRRAIYGFNGTPGILHRVQNHEEKMEDIKKLIWAILIIVLGIAAEGIYLAVQHVAATAK